MRPICARPRPRAAKDASSWNPSCTTPPTPSSPSIREHRVIDWNPGAVNLFGYTAEEARGRNLDEQVSRGSHYTEASGITRKVLSGQRLEGFETVRYRKDGTPVDVIAAGSPIMIGNVLAGVLAVYTDITDLKKIASERRDYEARIQQMQKMEGHRHAGRRHCP